MISLQSPAHRSIERPTAFHDHHYTGFDVYISTWASDIERLTASSSSATFLLFSSLLARALHSSSSRASASTSRSSRLFSHVNEVAFHHQASAQSSREPLSSFHQSSSSWTFDVISTIVYHYSIEDVTTSNPKLVGYPVFSIPIKGRVPSRHTVFSVEFPCTGKGVGSALVSFRLRFQTENYDGQDIKASPLNFQIEKECEKYESVSTSAIEVCHPPCLEGGVCSPEGRCDCKEGYYGLRCSQPLCIPHCYNGGTCIKPGLCACPEGFSGKICHLASCRDNCFNHGRCIAPGKCKCYRNWFGDICQYPVSREIADGAHPNKDKSMPNIDKMKEGINSNYSSE